MTNCREASRQHWTSDDSKDAINIGSLQRIADALELMSKDYDKLRRDKEWYDEHYKLESAKNRHLYRRVAALRGVITRLNRKKK